ncbi:sesquipedalian-1 [Neophocaena asiaeorientalis asiaeorientalis]|uniref:Sesquipedalian-1 n=1 Tax=Neophocaena asiaeorientalis asiaeorientalis TaxID=1706337 RepID=A0A341CIA7_NEOAA|nr:sesquipedalian-1 [Neophocaena asiaeorientalis asiaeorientalis]
MKLNERSLAFYATCDAPADNAGFLYKKGGRHAAYHRRWFVLRGNMLFYFEDAASREPVGVIILEGCTCRRASAPSGPLDSASFAQLHEWYGQEVRALRGQWLRSQAQP